MRRRSVPDIGQDIGLAVSLVLRDYRFYLRSLAATETADAKDFGARHAAGRGALAHLEQLLKLAGGSEDIRQDLAAQEALQQAREAIRASMIEHGGDPDHGGSA